MITYNLYKDTIHSLQAAATSTSMAWQLIRNECHKRSIPVPTMDKIQFIRKCSEQETMELKQIKKNH